MYPFHEDLAAIKKGTEWAFINREGEKVIDFRNDIVSSMSTDESYPMFVEGKCLIKKMIDDQYYYGYINNKGEVVIEPQYLNATNFTDGYAMIIKLDESKMGTNTILGKKMINLKLEEYIIDSSGKTVKFLDNSRGYIPSQAKKAPKFKSKRLASHLVAVKTEKGQWDIYKF